MTIKFLVFNFLFFAVCLSAIGQEDHLIDFAKIQQKKIRQLLNTCNLKETTDFNALQVGCSNSEEASFSNHIITYLIKKTPTEVWEAYKTASPSQSWNGKMATFGLMFNSDSKPLVYANESSEELKPGQIFYIQLKLLSGLFRLAVANKVVDVDDINKRFTICYIKNGASEGSQYIQLRESIEGYTLVEHKSVFRSKSKFRDRRLYPNIHEKIISEFHENIAATLGTSIYLYKPNFSKEEQLLAFKSPDIIMR